MSVIQIEDPAARSRICRLILEERGFIPLEELHGIWDEDNPCLLLVKRL